MKLWLISAPTRGYDVYSDAVVAAPNAKVAATIHPNRHDTIPVKDDDWNYTWVDNPDKVSVTYIGRAKIGTKQGVICASFHAG